MQGYVQGKLKQEIGEGQRDGKPIPEPHLGEIDTRAVGKEGQQLPAITLYRPAHRQKTAEDAGRKNHEKVIADAQKETLPADKIARLRAGVAAEMQAELETITGLYSADPAATKEIRGKLRSGIRRIGELNKTLYGFEPGKAPVVKRGKEEGPEGSDLPMEGDTAAGLPDFADIEGAHAIYKAKPKGVGNYLEYDHVIEATLAEKARALDLSAPAFSGGLEDQIEAGASTRAAGETPPEGGKAKTPAEIATTGRRRLSALSGPAFAGAPVLDYDREAAGTVALYRPVHREVTAQLVDVRGDILKAIDLTQAREKLVAYALSDPLDKSLKEAAIAELRAGIAKRFSTDIETHAGHIRDAYQIELKEFLALNRSKQAAAKMAAVIERVAGTLRTLRAESLSLVK